MSSQISADNSEYTQYSPVAPVWDFSTAPDGDTISTVQEGYSLAAAGSMPRAEFKDAVRLCHQGDRHFKKREYEKAEKDYVASLALLNTMPFPTETGWVTLRIGRAASRQRDHQRAAEFATTAVSIFEDVGDNRGLAAAHRLLGQMIYRAHDYRKALTHFKKSLDYLYGLDCDGEQGMIMNLIGKTSYRRGDYSAAIDSFLNAINKFEASDDIQGQLQALENLARAYFSSGLISEAYSTTLQRLRLCRRQRDLIELAWSCLSAARLSAALGSQGDFSRYIHEAEELFRSQGDADGLVECMNVRTSAA